MTPSAMLPAATDRFREKYQQGNCAWVRAPIYGDDATLLAANPVAVFQPDGDPFASLDQEMRRHPGCYAIGYFGYDLKRFIEKVPSRAVNDLGLPDCWFGFYEDVELLRCGLGQPALPVGRGVPTAPHVGTSNFTRDSYRQTVLRAKEYIGAGDIYQVNLSQRFQCEVPASAVEVYLALELANPAPYSAFLDIGTAQILSSSPECFLHLRDRHVLTRPIKGTRPRSVDPAELLASPKDNAELVMITDLERNDLGRVCEFGSVRVPELVRLESYATVHHLVSTVEGTLRPGVNHVECVRACFPGGSITGVPKIRAMEIIDELESHARGVYCGAIGFFAPDGVSQFNIAIRTVVYVGQPSRLSDAEGMTSESHVPPRSGRLTFHAGGGIVADSDPDAEYDETLAKAQGIINAITQLRIR